ncbi:hypothetical protein D7Z54_23950 [Salibacterium salarium]|uniref:Uncharacterized protein n=1 Tax=Salibacterium salarium TaxID=284579 RepID=A0A3R9Q095_9BACI|nr:hypothetical protein D7Z54_23950 [Salibacterium salarium]
MNNKRGRPTSLLQRNENFFDVVVTNVLYMNKNNIYLTTRCFDTTIITKVIYMNKCNGGAIC